MGEHDPTTNPFPAMNPYLERQWSDGHTTLIALIAEALSEILPPDLRSMAEEYREEDRWKDGLPSLWAPKSETMVLMSHSLCNR